MSATGRSIGEHLRDWRQRRRRSQLDLALEAEISTRHLSFVETGRASPSRAMVLRLAEHLEVPLRDRNAMLLAAGFAPVYRERPLDDPALRSARDAVAAVLAAHEPFPALALDRHWHVLLANRAVAPLLAGVAPALLAPPVNVLRLSLHPDGLAPRIANLGEWRAHLLARLRRQVAQSADPVLVALLAECLAYPDRGGGCGSGGSDIAVPLLLRSAVGDLSFLSTTTLFGTPTDVTLAELAIETLLPANPETAAALRTLLGSGPASDARGDRRL